MHRLADQLHRRRPRLAALIQRRQRLRRQLGQALGVCQAHPLLLQHRLLPGSQLGRLDLLNGEGEHLGAAGGVAFVLAEHLQFLAHLHQRLIRRGEGLALRFVFGVAIEQSQVLARRAAG